MKSLKQIVLTLGSKLLGFVLDRAQSYADEKDVPPVEKRIPKPPPPRKKRLHL